MGFHREMAAADLGPNGLTCHSGPSQIGLFRWPALFGISETTSDETISILSLTQRENKKGLQQTVPHMEMHEGHLITTDCASRGNAWGTSQSSHSQLLVLGGCRLCPQAPCFHTVSATGTEYHHHNGTSPQLHLMFSATGMEHHHSVNTPNTSSHWNGTSQLHPLL